MFNLIKKSHFYYRVKSFLLQSKSARQMFVKNVFWLSSSFVVGRLIKAFLIIAVARVLGTQQYGVFSYALSLAAFFTLFSDIGITSILTREAARSPEKQREYISTSFFIKVVLLIIVILFITFLAPHLTNIEAAKPLIPIMALLLAFDGMQGFAYAIVRARNQMEIEGVFSILTNIYITVLSFIVLFSSPSAYNIALSYTLGSGLGFITIFWALRKSFKGLFSNFKRWLIKDILVTGWSFSLVGLLGGIMINTDMIMLGWYRSAGELGLYSAAQRPIQLIGVIPGVVATSLFPTIARLAVQKESDRLKAIIEKVVSGIMMVALPLCIGGILLATPLMVLVFGIDYAASYSSFAILLGTMIVMCPGVIFSNLLFAYDRQKLFIISALIGIFSNFIFNLLLIPSYGIAGSSFSTLITQIFVNGFIWYQARKVQAFHLLPRLIKIFAATAGMALTTAALLFAGVSVIPNVIISALVYGLLLLALREPLVKETLSTLRSFIRSSESAL